MEENLEKMRSALKVFSVLFTVIVLSETEVWGQESKETRREVEEESELHAYVVVASRTPITMERTSPSISVVYKEEIEDRQYQRLEDVLRILPGLSLATTGQRGAVTSLFTRGTNSDHTAFLLDGRKLNGGFSGSYNLAQLGLENIESVEVMRGASSTLYGAEGLGGVVNLRYRHKTDREGQAITATGEGGSFDSYRATLSGEWESDRVGASLGISHFETANQEPNSRYRITNLMPRFRFKLDERAEIDLVGLYYNSDIGTPDNRKSFAYPALFDFQTTKSWMISPGLSWKYRKALSARLFYSRSEDRIEAKNVGFFFHTDSRTHTNQVDLQVDWSPTDNVTGTVGAVYFNQDYLQEDLLFGGRPFDNSWNSRSIYGQIQWQTKQNFFLTGGVRYDDYSDFGSPLTWNLSINRKLPLFGADLFAKAATAYGTPQAIDLYGIFGNPELNAEESDSWEFGIKQKLYGEKISWSALFFHNDFVNLITGFPPVNAGRAFSEGLETSFRLTPHKRLLIYANYTYLTAENLDSNSRLARRPRHQGTIGLRLRDKRGLTAGFEFRFVSDREDIDGGTFVRIDGEDYSVARIYGSYRISESFSVFGRVENLFNEQYDEVDGFKTLDMGAYFGARLSFR